MSCLDNMWESRFQLIVASVLLLPLVRCLLKENKHSLFTTKIGQYIIGKWIYNSFFHPLAKIPGPRSWGGSNLPFLYSLLRGTLIHDLERLHRRYGRIIRIGPDAVDFAHSNAWADIFQPRPGLPHFPKYSPWWDAPGGPSMFNTKDIQAHARMRKTLSPGFTDRALRAQEHVLLQYINLLIRRLTEVVEENDKVEHAVATIDVFPWLNFVTFDIFGDLGFAEAFNCLERSEYHPWIDMLFKSVKGAAFLFAVKKYPKFDWLLEKLLPPSLRKVRANHYKVITDKLDRRMNLEVARPDIIGYTLKEAKEGKGMSREEIEPTFAVLTIAGSETTATALGGIFNYLIKNADKRDKLIHAIRSEFDSDDSISITRTSQMPYIRAVINEGLRLSPPVPWILPRVVPARGAAVCGTWLPEGVSLVFKT